MILKKLLFFIGLLCSPILAQNYLIDSIQDKYTFVNWKANQIKLAEKSPMFKKLFHKLDTIQDGNEEDVHIFHMGGSHIQADIYSNRLRSYLQNMSKTAKGQRGFIYPYSMAKTNNPSNYKVESDGKWMGYRCSIKKDSVAWGLSGVTAVFKDSLANINVMANNHNYIEKMYEFRSIRIFYDDWSKDYKISLKDSTLVSDVKENKEAHFIEFCLSRSVENIEFCVQRVGDPETSEFLMMGIELINDNAGIQYTTIGTNGASFAFFDRCSYFEDQFLLYKPDLFIVSIGTNDTYTPDFNVENFKCYYEDLIQLIQLANPDCAILLTVPNDSYYKKKYPNPRTRIARKVIYELAEKYQMAIWDFYEIMGGFNSSRDWYNNKLMYHDRVHFTELGYHIKADLLLQALAHSWEKEMNLETNTILNQIINE